MADAVDVGQNARDELGLRAWRVRRGLSQMQAIQMLADFVGEQFAQSEWSAWESGSRRLSKLSAAALRMFMRSVN